MRNYVVWCMGAIAFVPLHSDARAQPFDDLVIFGDSLSDVGNVGSTFLGQFSIPSENHGDRFSNGPVWAEVLAGGLGLPVDLFSRGSGPNDDNYAHGGATSGNGTSSLGVIRNLGRQLDDYEDVDSPAAGDLHILWIGGNDYIDGQSNTDIPANNIRNALNTLIADGATQFLVPNLPPLGQTPDHRGSSNEATLDTLAASHNAKLADHLAALDDNPELAFYRLDVFGLFQDVLADPAAFEFVNTTGRGIDTVRDDNPSTNPDGYLFWDGLHPTGEGHALLAGRGLEGLLEPINGDSTLDRVIDADDIDLLRSAIASSIEAARYNIDGIGGVNADDVVALVETELDTRFGDVDLDRTVNANDLAAILANYGTTDPGWSQGEVTGDGRTNGRDFLTWQSAHGFTADGAAVAATPVPESASWLLALCAGLPLCARRANSPASWRLCESASDEEADAA
ncbi:SGNH/GDSL hydrolase family protein [Pirellulales bacterium]|nr:SGNH/GDSL hydrolase family protein [Pirellulales bacterium]